MRRAADLLVVGIDLGESGVNSRQYVRSCAAVITAAQQAGDALAEGRARLMHSHLLGIAGQFADSSLEAGRALRLGLVANDPVVCAQAPNQQGIIALYDGRHEEAEGHLTQALTAFRDDRNHPGEASALCNLSRVHLATGRTDSAVSLARQGVAMYERDDTGMALRLANGKYALGLALTSLGRTRLAHDTLTEALHMFQAARQRLWHGMTLFRIAEVHLADQRTAQAAACAEQALVVLHGIGGDWRRANVLTVLGRGLHGIGQTDRAKVCWQEALAIFENSGSPEAKDVRKLLSAAPVV
ncbi:AfsR family transcriptional regulator OS=Streptomyces alboniger OX=132473 GN=CP975_15065 PE=3 SV=1 [Streptomyces alboniger]